MFVHEIRHFLLLDIYGDDNDNDDDDDEVAK